MPQKLPEKWASGPREGFPAENGDLPTRNTGVFRGGNRRLQAEMTPRGAEFPPSSTFQTASDVDFIAYLKTLKPADWDKMATAKWTVKDVVAHMVGWEKRDAEVLKIFWETKQRSPWMSTKEEWDEFNRKEVERYKNYAPRQLIEEWEMWQGKVAEEIEKIGYQNIKSRPDLFDWLIEDEGHYTLGTGGSHYEHHYRQVKAAVENVKK